MEFDKDDKKTKVTARKMMKMMFAINKDNFEGTAMSAPVIRAIAELPNPQALPSSRTRSQRSKQNAGKHPASPNQYFLLLTSCLINI
jgi:hypothetical protein